MNLSPTNTVESVAEKLASGLMGGSIVLPDLEPIERNDFDAETKRIILTEILTDTIKSSQKKASKFHFAFVALTNSSIIGSVIAASIWFWGSKDNMLIGALVSLAAALATTASYTRLEER